METDEVILETVEMPEKWKDAIRFCQSPRTVATIAARHMTSYAYAGNMMAVLKAGEWVKRDIDQNCKRAYITHPRVKL